MATAGDDFEKGVAASGGEAAFHVTDPAGMPAVDVEVVSRVHDGRDVGSRHGADEPSQELPRADATRERDDLHERRA